MEIYRHLKYNNKLSRHTVEFMNNNPDIVLIK